MSYLELAIPFVSPGEVLAAGITIPLVGIAAVGLRFWLRARQRAGIGADDYLILLALVWLLLFALRTYANPCLLQSFVIGMGICLIYGEFLPG